MSVKITVLDKIYVKSPYDAGFVSKARSLGGKWDGAKSAWAFDTRDEQRVRDACIEVYGTDGSPTATATIRVVLDRAGVRGDTFKIAGYDVLHKYGRDVEPRLGGGVIVIAGKLKERGGSAKYPEITFTEGTILEVRDVPVVIAEKLVADDPDAYSIIGAEEPVVLPTEREQIAQWFESAGLEGLDGAQVAQIIRKWRAE